MCWDRPEQKRSYNEEELAVIQHAAHAFTAAIVSALAGFGHNVKIEKWKDSYTPMILVAP
ncbi:hypothetical protein [Kitasatospora sp. CB02891]|uniref:hypothetical protein n=1 Tax=Kitasatospora sp. CB02891 TaxID=2020329 RepID=UPI000C27B2ED|nr:hypothetical protein [Kitasatospora sp. CB02891]PJN25674.1 hypothetical protein CG736_15010 [Kitasatospora sp. CB02891]